MLLKWDGSSSSANNVTITAYHEGIFDLIFDKYEEEYINRFIRPRRGSNPPDSEEVMRFWEYLKDDSELHDVDTSGLQFIASRLGAGDICSLLSW